ncbi:DUF58 domain-containing protein [Microbacterium sp. P03]|uniref:DUF58 domain-containing protein n=1 Tax=Microbacterium sp. P03 TaxID=3366946 RepID=UPI00374740D6
MRRLWPLTVRGTGALVLALICFVLANELGLVELRYFGMLLLALLLGSVVALYLTRRTETVTRALHPDVATVDHAIDVTVRVGVRTALATPPGAWSDALTKGLTGAAAGAFPAVGSGLRGTARTVELEYSVTGMKRGIHSLGPLSITSTDPFGVARRRNVLGGRTPVTVAPEIIELPAVASFAGAAGGTLPSSTTQMGQGADNLIARPYAPGDARHRIHWRATAHRDSLMVRQEEQESTPEAVVVLDRGTPRWVAEAARTPGADPGFERAVTACISVAAHLVHAGFAVTVIDSDGSELVERLEGGDLWALEEAAAQFATITTHGVDTLPHLPELFAGTTIGPIVVVTGRLEEQDATSLRALVHHSSLPVLLSTAPSREALELAVDTGWQAASIALDVDLADAWSSTTSGGVGHVVR